MGPNWLQRLLAVADTGEELSWPFLLFKSPVENSVVPDQLASQYMPITGILQVNCITNREECTRLPYPYLTLAVVGMLNMNPVSHFNLVVLFRNSSQIRVCN